MDVGHLSVLIVEDLGGTREILQDMLEEIGFRTIHQARDGKEALQKLREVKVDLAICDYQVGDMTGADLIKAFSKDRAGHNISFIMISCRSEAEVIERSMESGAVFVSKPVHFTTLKNKVQEVIRRRGETKERHLNPRPLI